MVLPRMTMNWKRKVKRLFTPGQTLHLVYANSSPWPPLNHTCEPPALDEIKHRWIAWPVERLSCLFSCGWWIFIVSPTRPELTPHLARQCERLCSLHVLVRIISCWESQQQLIFYLHTLSLSAGLNLRLQLFSSFLLKKQNIHYIKSQLSCILHAGSFSA